ncbi:hypothetical protein BC828DRAFT_382791 [Blastocladiella britannica]|nr:hypothetical protein BC828DRAFT_382791 [Blastocladiella britannica]
MQRIPRDTTWNKHGEVGATLLANWVEERAVGSDRILRERNVPYLSRQGHSNLLEQRLHEDPAQKFTTVSRLSYQPSGAHEKRRFPSPMGKLRTLKEKAWTTEAIEHLQPKTIRHPTIYETSTAGAHFDPTFSPSLSPSKLPPSLVLASSYVVPAPPMDDAPITFWSHHVARGAHTTYASKPHGMHPESVARTCVVGHTAVPELLPGVGAARTCRFVPSPTSDGPGSVQEVPIEHVVSRATASFGRITTFSTPIAETVDAPHKP